jgi:hypothetical protein
MIEEFKKEEEFKKDKNIEFDEKFFNFLAELTKE